MAKKVKDREQDAEPIEQEMEEGGNSFESFVSENQRLLLLAVGILILLGGGYAFYKYNQAEQNVEANAEMFQAVKEFERDSLDKALNGSGNFMGFEEISSTFSGTKVANMADYYTGIIYLRKGDLQTGVEYLEKFDKGDDMVSMAAYAALGFAYEDLGDPSKAAGFFEKAARTPEENESTSPNMLLQAGRNYEAAGNASKAKDLYETIKEDYPNSSEALNIDKYLGRVSQ
ncbi:MAG: tetratricopeptide repeat protein [Bacteroidota bacterium]